MIDQKYESDHTSFWDCHEREQCKRSAQRLTPTALCDKIEVHTCTDCGRRHVLEEWRQDGEIVASNRYGVRDGTTIAEIVATYRDQ